jgi:DNA-binding PadR family transcriptional regulator
MGLSFNTMRLMGSVARRSEGFGGEVVLGLLSRQPANCYQLDQRLGERFGSAEYTHGTARQAIKRLVNEGLVRAVDVEEHVAGDGSRSGTTTYEVTQAGVERFCEWMWASVSTPPVREELHAKVALCQPADLPRMIEVVREAEMVCAGKLNGLNWRIRSRRRDTDPEDWQVRMDLVVSTGDQAWWESRIKWLQQVRTYLESEWRRCQPKSGSRTVIRRMA